MAAGFGDSVDGLGAQFAGELRQLLGRQIFHVVGVATRSSSGVLETSDKRNSEQSCRRNSRVAFVWLTPDQQLRAIQCAGVADAISAVPTGPLFGRIAAIISSGLVARVTRSKGPQQIR